MPKFIIEWDAGYGPNEQIIFADDVEAAKEAAHLACLEEVESYISYDAVLATPEELKKREIEVHP